MSQTTHQLTHVNSVGFREKPIYLNGIKPHTYSLSEEDLNDYLNQIIHQMTNLKHTRTLQQADTHNQPGHRDTGTKAAEDLNTPG